MLRDQDVDGLEGGLVTCHAVFALTLVACCGIPAQGQRSKA